jgi:hypothetical protein
MPMSRLGFGAIVGRLGAVAMRVSLLGLATVGAGVAALARGMETTRGAAADFRGAVFCVADVVPHAAVRNNKTQAATSDAPVRKRRRGDNSAIVACGPGR